MPTDIGDVITEVTTAAFSVVSAANLAILAASGFVLALAARFGPRVVKALR